MEFQKLNAQLRFDETYIDALVQGCSTSIANALEILHQAIATTNIEELSGANFTETCMHFDGL